MPLTRLEPTAALVVVDLQKGLAGRALAHPFEDVVARSAELAARYRELRLPVVLVNVAGRAPGRTEAGGAPAAPPAADWAELVPGLGAQPGDHRVTKRTWGAFHGTDLDERLRGAGVTQVVLTGVATSIGVESTARAAYEHGYDVVLVTDAMTDMSAEAHAASVERIFPRLGERATTAELLDRAVADR
jgi:nicotinamidase-related amidase